MAKNQLYSINIEDAIRRYAWKQYKSEIGLAKRIFHRKSKYDIDIRWGFVEFKHERKYFKLRPDKDDPLPVEVTSASENVGNPETREKPPVTLYTSEYENRTPMDQQYSFNTTRETTASTSIEFQESYTKGGECNIEISVPGDIVTVGAGLSGELSVTETEGQTFEETMSWQVDTQINVKKGHKAEATVKVFEKTSIADFEVETTVSIMEGKDLPVGIREIKTGKLVYTVPIPDLRFAFFELAEKNGELVKLVPVTDSTNNMKRHNLILTTRGTCKSVSWKNQQVEVKSDPIEGFVLPPDSDSGAGTPTATDGGN